MDNNTIIYNGFTYTLATAAGLVRVYISEDERSCVIRDFEGNSEIEIVATTICNSGFLKIS